MIGMKVGRLTVIEKCEKRVKPCGQKETMYLCECDCGSQVRIRKSQLTRGKTQSCGCISRELASKRCYKHGMSYTKIRGVYNTMKQRCSNPNVHAYANYGGRGIAYSQYWESFSCFLSDMLPGYRDGLTIERIDVNGNYCKGNCKWVPMDEQARNKRNSIKIDLHGQLLNMSQISKLTGINYNTLRNWYYQKGIDYIRKIVA